MRRNLSLRGLSMLVAGLMAAGVLTFGAGFTTNANAAETTQRVVNVSTPQEFVAAVASDTKIVLEGKTYDLTNLNGDSGRGYVLKDLNNLTIEGTTGTKILIQTGGQLIFLIVNCQNLQLNNLIMGHDIPAENQCDAGVLWIEDSAVTIDNCDIFGCGYNGIEMDQYDGTCTLTVRNSKIRDCSHIGIIADGGTGTFTNCEISGHEHRIAAVGTNAKLTFTGCTFSDNGREVDESSFWQTYDLYAFYADQGSVSFSGCTFENNKSKYLMGKHVFPDIEDYPGDKTNPNWRMYAGYWMQNNVKHETYTPQMSNCTGSNNAWGELTSGTSDRVFSDIPANAYYTEAVEWAYEKGITSGLGDGTFGRGKTMTRAEAATFLYSYSGKVAASTDAPFTDVSAAWQKPGVNWAYATRVTVGTSATTFEPNRPVTRGEAMTFLFKTVGGASGSASSFSDVPAGHMFYDFVSWGAANSITSGVGNNQFGVNDQVKREDFVVWMFKADKLK